MKTCHFFILSLAMTIIAVVLSRPGEEEGEEAPFSVISTTADYEEREYPGMNWVCSSEMNIVDLDNEKSPAFRELFGYIQGQNDQGTKIEMTSPVSYEVKRGETADEGTASMCFFIGQAHQANTPKPTNPKLSIVAMETRFVYTRTVPGHFKKVSQWREEEEELATLLTRDGIAFRNDLVYWNSYDAPWKTKNRRNEVWVVKSG